MILKNMSLTVVTPFHSNYNYFKGNQDSGNVFRINNYDTDVVHSSPSLSDLLPLKIDELQLGNISALRIDLTNIPYKCKTVDINISIKNFEGYDICEILERNYV